MPFENLLHVPRDVFRGTGAFQENRHEHGSRRGRGARPAGGRSAR